MIDRARLESVLWPLWQKFRRDFEITPITEIQDLRAFSILWAAVFIPEAISSLLMHSMYRAIWQYSNRADYNNFCWFRTLPIEAALFALTGSERDLSPLLLNLDHHNSSLRSVTIESLALVADRLEFGDDTLRRIAHNLEVRHFFGDWPVILYAISKAPPRRKRQQIEQWLKTYSLNSNEQSVLETLARGEWVDNPFLHRALRTQQFLVLSLASQPPEPSELPFDLEDEQHRIASETAIEKSDQLQLFAGNQPIDDQLVWQRLTKHPLSSSMINISLNASSRKPASQSNAPAADAT